MPPYQPIQLDTAVPCAAGAACSGAIPVIAPIQRRMGRRSAGGISDATFSQIASSTRYAVVFQSDSLGAVGEPGMINWTAGDFVVTLNVTVANSNLLWVATYICRISNTCTNKATVGSLTGQTISLGVPGAVTMTIPGSAQAGVTENDRIAIICVFQNTSGMLQSASILPNQPVVTPIDIPSKLPLGVGP